jgi:hypothetical protein
MNIYCVKGVAAYHEFACAMRAVCATVPSGTVAHAAHREFKNVHKFVTVQNQTHVYMNFFDHKDLGNHLLQ